MPAAAFLAAWHAGDYPAMYDLVAPGVQASLSYRKFAHEYRDVARTASMTGLRAEGRLHATQAHGDGAGVGRDDHVRPHLDGSSRSRSCACGGRTGSPGRRR